MTRMNFELPCGSLWAAPLSEETIDVGGDIRLYGVDYRLHASCKLTTDGWRTTNSYLRRQVADRLLRTDATYAAQRKADQLCEDVAARLWGDASFMGRVRETRRSAQLREIEQARADVERLKAHLTAAEVRLGDLERQLAAMPEQ